MDGPWKTDARYKECKERVAQLFTTSRPDQHPLFVELAPRIFKELTLPLGDAASLTEAWRMMLADGPLGTKGYMVNLNRFHGFIEELTRIQDMWWQRFFVFMFACLESGYISGQKVQALRFRWRPGEVHESVGAEVPV